MQNGFTLIELLIAVLIIGVLSAVAVPYYFNAAESARMTEAVVLWGRTKILPGPPLRRSASAPHRITRPKRKPLKIFYLAHYLPPGAGQRILLGSGI